ncbi:UBX domain-containing protein 7 [Lasioglossum baleicum]|uniref:UBX domain-containing protein 7 n=1 Tax=Lasioglossum baleicum TaxID=434251 RepID=UPI003FCD6B91
MDPELIEKFIEVTGETEDVARQYLTLTDGNVEAAITVMFEGGQAPEQQHANPDPEPELTYPDPEPDLNDTEPETRPPILPTQEILVPSDPACSFSRMSEDRFRDFKIETQRQEEEMARRVAGLKSSSKHKSNRFEDLFLRPYSILCLGSFFVARERANSLNRWLLVNIQNPQEFACLVLNRDVWSNRQIKEIVKDHFIFWQALSNTNNGKRYIDFYNVSKYPYVAVIDPRTGECMKTYHHITVDILIFALNDMLSTHPSPECVSSESVSPKKLSNNTATATTTNEDSATNLTSNHDNNTRTSKHLIDSLKDIDGSNSIDDVQSSSSRMPVSESQNTNKKKRIDEPDLKEKIQKRSKDESCKPKFDLNKDKTNSETIRLCLRLPNGKKETMSMYAANTIEDFIDQMESLGYPPSDHSYLVPFPKTNIGELSPETHLSDTILSPANTVFITKL